MKEEKNNKIILYKTEDGNTEIEVNLEGETVWLSQKQMAELFDCTPENILLHFRNIFESGELGEEATTKESLVVQKEGNRVVNRTIRFYSLDAIISVGYRINSLRGTQFRIWATQKLKEYMVKGFVMDDERLAEGGVRKSFFEEWLERVRKIRTSEKNLYEKVKDIFATSVDYDPRTDFTKEFYATMQNKFHYAITGSTAAELVVNRKLYLLVEQFLSFAEFQIERKNIMHMKDWVSYLHEMLKANKLEVLFGKGKISHDKMEKIVKNELKKFIEQKRLK